MYIHSYQIHNVLNVYRKQLSQGMLWHHPDGSAKRQAAHDRIDISIDGQRQSLFDKISSEIVERITSYGPNSEFEDILAGQMADPLQAAAQAPSSADTDAMPENNAAFTYTVINEHNQKITHRLPIRQLCLPGGDIQSTTEALKDYDTDSESE